MGNPQVENGYLKIANELFEALVRTRIPGEARQMLDLIIRKTYGHNKKHDRISTSQIMEETGLSHIAVYKARRKLKEMNLITTSEKGESYITNYSINKLYKTWKVSPKKETVKKESLPKRSVVSPKKEGNCLPKGETQKTKDTITKDKESPASPDLSKQISLKDIDLKGQSEGTKHAIFNKLVDTFRVRGWREEAEYIKKVFQKIVSEMEGYNPKEFFPYFKRVAENHVNKNAELYAADARISRGKEKKIGLVVAGVEV